MRKKLCNIATYLTILLALSIIVYGFWWAAPELGTRLQYAGSFGALVFSAFTGTAYNVFASLVACGSFLVNPLAQLAIGYYLCRIVLEAFGLNPGSRAAKAGVAVAIVLLAAYAVALVLGCATSTDGSIFAYIYLYGFVDKGLLVVSPFFLVAGVALAFAHRPLFKAA
jgi:hypothetical protein